MNDIELKTIAKDGKARFNQVTLNGKTFKTPIFMPVATKGALKSLPFKYLEQSDIILGNTYHLYLALVWMLLENLTGCINLLDGKN